METEFVRPVPRYRDGEWKALNGHLMAGRYVSWDGGNTWRSEGWSARHSGNCQCETEGADIEDW